MSHLEAANSSVMAVLCGITILIVLLQPILFLAAAVKRGKELNMTKEEMKNAAVSSAVFSIIPSLPIIISYLILVPSLGRYFPWLRLSVVGSASYETMVANMFLGLYGTMAAPHLTNFSSIPALSAILVAGIAALLLGKLSTKVKRLKEFSFALSMVIGMLASCVVNAMLV